MSVSRLDSYTMLKGGVTPIVANGDSDAFPVPINGYLTIAAFGTFGAGTLTLKISHDGVNWVTHGGFSLTAAGAQTVQVVAAAGCKVTLTGATSPSLTVQVCGIDNGG